MSLTGFSIVYFIKNYNICINNLADITDWDRLKDDNIYRNKIYTFSRKLESLIVKDFVNNPTILGGPKLSY